MVKTLAATAIVALLAALVVLALGYVLHVSHYWAFAITCFILVMLTILWPEP